MQMQDMQHILKILTLAESAVRIGIILGPDAGDIELLAAHALKERLGEKASILNALDSLQDRWTHLFKKEHPRKETALALDVEQHPVDELRYEKENGVLRIFLSSQNPLPKEAFSMEERFPPSDMIIAIGFSDQEKLAHALKTETPVKNDNAVISLYSQLPATPLSIPPLRAEERVPVWNLDTMKLWSRALLRSYVEDGNAIFWAFLPKEDFQKTNQTADVLPALVTGIRRTMNIPPLAVVLWQDQNNPETSVHIIFSDIDSTVLEKLSRLTGTPITNNVLVTGSYANFSVAEVEARKIIKQLT